jgi:hypothetical protein
MPYFFSNLQTKKDQLSIIQKARRIGCALVFGEFSFLWVFDVNVAVDLTASQNPAKTATVSPEGFIIAKCLILRRSRQSGQMDMV